MGIPGKGLLPPLARPSSPVLPGGIGRPTPRPLPGNAPTRPGSPGPTTRPTTQGGPPAGGDGAPRTSTSLVSARNGPRASLPGREPATANASTASTTTPKPPGGDSGKAGIPGADLKPGPHNAMVLARPQALAAANRPSLRPAATPVGQNGNAQATTGPAGPGEVNDKAKELLGMLENLADGVRGLMTQPGQEPRISDEDKKTLGHLNEMLGALKGINEQFNEMLKEIGKSIKKALE